MKKNGLVGTYAPHSIGLVMRECVRQALYAIRNERITFIAKAKNVSYKTEEDLVTSADIAAQAIYVKILNEHFPDAGIIAEEDFSRKCTHPTDNFYFTIDPLDGTKAYGRRQSHGVSTMISFVHNGVVEGITIGDPNSMELFHSRPGTTKVSRIYDLETAVQLSIDPALCLKKQYLQLRTDPRKLSAHAQQFVSIDPSLKIFKDIEVIGGSIGITFSRLWKGEVGAVLLDRQQTAQTPWDSSPVMGMSQKMGFIFFEIVASGLRQVAYIPSEKNTATEHEMLIVHRSRIEDLRKSMKKGIITDLC